MNESRSTRKTVSLRTMKPTITFTSSRSTKGKALSLACVAGLIALAILGFYSPDSETVLSIHQTDSPGKKAVRSSDSSNSGMGFGEMNPFASFDPAASSQLPKASQDILEPEIQVLVDKLLDMASASEATLVQQLNVPITSSNLHQAGSTLIESYHECVANNGMKFIMHDTCKRIEILVLSNALEPLRQMHLQGSDFASSLLIKIHAASFEQAAMYTPDRLSPEQIESLKSVESIFLQRPNLVPEDEAGYMNLFKLSCNTDPQKEICHRVAIKDYQNRLKGG